MTCAECIARSGEYVDDTLDSLGRARFQHHLRQCLACARYVRVLSRGLDVVHGLEPVHPTPGFQLRLHRRLRGLHEERLAQERTVLAGAMVTVALAAAIALVAWLPLLEMSSPAATAQLAAPDEPVSASIEAVERAPAAAAWPVPDLWTPWTRPAVSPPPSMTAAFPGPYSPLVVQPPAVGRSVGRVVLTAYIVE